MENTNVFQLIFISLIRYMDYFHLRKKNGLCMALRIRSLKQKKN